jgi:hypothetical protein
VQESAHPETFECATASNAAFAVDAFMPTRRGIGFRLNMARHGELFGDFLTID